MRLMYVGTIFRGCDGRHARMFTWRPFARHAGLRDSVNIGGIPSAEALGFDIPSLPGRSTYLRPRAGCLTAPPAHPRLATIQCQPFCFHWDWLPISVVRSLSSR